MNVGLKEVARMKPRITVLTVSVDDQEESLRFYRDGLGLMTEGIIGKEFDYGAVAFFELQDGLKFAIWPRKSLAHDSGIALGEPAPPSFQLAAMLRPGQTSMQSWSGREGRVRPS